MDECMGQYLKRIEVRMRVPGKADGGVDAKLSEAKML